MQKAGPSKPKPRRGRNPLEDRGEVILSNGLSARQWEWIQQEAANKMPKVDAAWYQRFMVQTFIDAVEKSRADIREIVTPELDKEFEAVTQGKQNPKSNKSTKI